MDEQKRNINCRVCLRYDLKKSEKCFSLFEKHNNSMISEKIKCVANVEIKEGDGLPDKICPDCILQLETALAFKQKCETSDKILQNIVQKASKICKITFTMPVKKEEKNEEEIELEDALDDTVDDNDVEQADNESKPPEHRKKVVPEDTNEKVEKKSKAKDLKLICDDCGGSFKSKCKIAVHWKKVHLPNKLICPRCKRMFKSYQAFNVHAKKQTRSCLVSTKVRIEGQGRARVFHCQDCTYNTKRIKDMDAHLATHSGDRRFQCSDCPKTFTQHASLQGHRESYHKDYRVEITCHYCGKFIKGRSRYYKHLRTHRPKYCQCEVCKKTFKNRTNLMIHMKRHSGVRSYTCETCSANFYTPGELCNHRRRVHFKAKTFNCDLCEYSTYTAAALKRHKSRHTEDNVVCLMCGTFVENAEKLILHQKRHLEKNFACPHCDGTFYIRDSLRRHMVKKHSNIVTSNKKAADKVNNVDIKQEYPPDRKYNEVTISPIIKLY